MQTAVKSSGLSLCLPMDGDASMSLGRDSVCRFQLEVSEGHPIAFIQRKIVLEEIDTLSGAGVSKRSTLILGVNCGTAERRLRQILHQPESSGDKAGSNPLHSDIIFEKNRYTSPEIKCVSTAVIGVESL